MRNTLQFTARGTLLCTLLAADVSAQQLPDVAGIRLGMPAREGFAALQAKSTKTKLDTYPLQLPTVEKPILIGYSVGFSPSRSPDERIAVHVTPPPEKQAVWKVQRFVGRQKILRANVIASLREKYGKETAGASNGTLVRDVEREAHELWWIFDEQGQPGKFAPDYNEAYKCLNMFANASDQAASSVTFYAEGGGGWWAPDNIMMMQDRIGDSGWCNTSMIAVVAYIGAEEIVTAFGVQALHVPLALRSARAEVVWLNDLATRQQQQQLNEAKQAKPKL